MKQLDTGIVIGSGGHLVLSVVCNDFSISLEDRLGPTSLFLQFHAKWRSCQRVLQVPSPRVISHHWELIATCVPSPSQVWPQVWWQAGIWSQAQDGEPPLLQSVPGEVMSPSPRELGHQHLPSIRSSVWDSLGGSSLKMWLFSGPLLVLWEVPLSADISSCT